MRLTPPPQHAHAVPVAVLLFCRAREQVKTFFAARDLQKHAVAKIGAGAHRNFFDAAVRVMRDPAVDARFQFGNARARALRMQFAHKRKRGE